MSTVGISSPKQAIRWSRITVGNQSEIVTKLRKYMKIFDNRRYMINSPPLEGWINFL